MVVVYDVTGEVSERQERLDGEALITLDGVLSLPDGAATADAPDGAATTDVPDGAAIADVPNGDGAEVSISLSWLLGRDGAEALGDGDLVLWPPEAAETAALLTSGTAEVDPETGLVRVDGRLIVDGAGWLPDTTALRLEIEIGVEDWRGRLTIGAASGPE